MVALNVPVPDPVESAFHAAAPLSLADALLLSCDLEIQGDLDGALRVLRVANPPPIAPGDSIPPEN